MRLRRRRVLYTGPTQDQENFEELTGIKDPHLGKGVLTVGRIYIVDHVEERGPFIERIFLKHWRRRWFNNKCFAPVRSR